MTKREENVNSFITKDGNIMYAMRFMKAIPQGQKKAPRVSQTRGAHDREPKSLEKGAATYSPALHCSTIGAGGLNFSVRDGKRWDPAAIAT